MALTKVIGAGAEGLTLSSTSLTVANGLTLTDGDVTLASGHGINFSGTDNSGGANQLELFSDYEEGTWTPQFAASSSNPNVALNASGTYTKMGRLVYCTWFIQITSVTSQGSGTLRIGPLPFNLTTDSTGSTSNSIENGAYFYQATAFGFSSLNTLTGRGIGTDQILITDLNSSGSATTKSTGSLTTGYTMGSYIYITDS